MSESRLAAVKSGAILCIQLKFLILNMIINKQNPPPKSTFQGMGSIPTVLEEEKERAAKIATEDIYEGPADDNYVPF